MLEQNSTVYVTGCKENNIRDLHLVCSLNIKKSYAKVQKENRVDVQILIRLVFVNTKVIVNVLLNKENSKKVEVNEVKNVVVYINQDL